MLISDCLEMIVSQRFHAVSVFGFQKKYDKNFFTPSKIFLMFQHQFVSVMSAAEFEIARYRYSVAGIRNTSKKIVA